MVKEELTEDAAGSTTAESPCFTAARLEAACGSSKWETKESFMKGRDT